MTESADRPVRRVVVVGAGVIGLTCAVRLLEAGHEVAVLARDLPLETTSAVAAAIWYPYRAFPFDQVTAWAAASYTEFARLAADHDTGVAMRLGTEVLPGPTPTPWWASAVPDLHDVEGGWSFTAPVVDMAVYLTWLVGRVEALGGTITRMALAGLPDAAEVVVNASGLGSRLLAHDVSTTPVRGQVLRLSQVGLEQWRLDSSGPTYVVPRAHDIVVGGTEQEGDWDPTPDPAQARDILDRAVALVPALRRATVLAHRVGLRPARPTVRLEAARASGRGLLVHCYGHGGAGVTLSWGCADEVVALVAG